MRILLRWINAPGAAQAYVVSLLFFIGLLMRPADQPGYWHWCAPHACFLVLIEQTHVSRGQG